MAQTTARMHGKCSLVSVQIEKNEVLMTSPQLLGSGPLGPDSGSLEERGPYGKSPYHLGEGISRGAPNQSLPLRRTFRCSS
jgi:hypothetical protein